MPSSSCVLDLVDECLDVVERPDMALVDNPETKHVRLIDGEAPRTLHGDDVGHVPELAVAVTGSEHDHAADSRGHAFGATGRASRVCPLPGVAAPVDVAQRRDVRRALSPGIVVKAWAERERAQCISDDVGGAGACRGRSSSSRRFLLAAYRGDLRPYALELRQ